MPCQLVVSYSTPPNEHAKAMATVKIAKPLEVAWGTVDAKKKRPDTFHDILVVSPQI